MFRLRELRKSKKINQSILAEYMGVTQATLSAWETERYAIDSKSLMRLADYFDCSTDYLLGRVDYPELVIKVAPMLATMQLIKGLLNSRRRKSCG